MYLASLVALLVLSLIVGIACLLDLFFGRDPRLEEPGKVDDDGWVNGPWAPWYESSERG